MRGSFDFEHAGDRVNYTVAERLYSRTTSVQATPRE